MDPTDNNPTPTNTTFDWFEIFRGGTQTDSSGATVEFSHADLDQVVTNFTPNYAPLVIGHPETNDPAWGWATEIKREGDVLFAKASSVEPAFYDAVAKHRYPNRSVRLEYAENNTYRLAHIGFLGGKPPAVDGLAWQFNKDAKAISFEFAAPDMALETGIQVGRALKRLWKGIRNYITESSDIDTADRVAPEWQEEWLMETVVRAEVEQESSPHEFNQADEQSNQQPTKESSMTKEEEAALKAQLRASEDRVQQMQFNQRITDARQFIAAEVNGGDAPCITSDEQVEELAQLIASLPDEKPLNFAKADGSKVEKTPAQVLKDFMKSLPKQTHLTKDFSKKTPAAQQDGDEMDAETLTTRALSYQKKMQPTGGDITTTAAIEAVKAGNDA